jgi:murein hydrolase activator
MRLRAALTACLLCGAAGAAETVPAAMVLERLEAASVAFRDAATVPELSGAVLGFEAGLADLGDGLRETAVREIQLSGDLQRREAELSRLLSLLMRVDKGAPVVYAMHPASLVDAARAGMLSAEVDQALQTRARQLRKELDELSALRRLQDNAESVLTQSLRDAEAARAALGTAMTERTDLNLRFAADLVRLAILTSSASTLEEFLAGLPQISATPITPSKAISAIGKGNWSRRFRMSCRSGPKGIGCVSQPDRRHW